MGSIFDEENFNHNKYELYKDRMKREKMMAECETNLGTNKVYSMLVQDYVRCVTFYMGEFPYSPFLEMQLKRTDLDTVCAYELY